MIWANLGARRSYTYDNETRESGESEGVSGEEALLCGTYAQSAGYARFGAHADRLPRARSE
jgi:hypothetical protein